MILVYTSRINQTFHQPMAILRLSAANTCSASHLLPFSVPSLNFFSQAFDRLKHPTPLRLVSVLLAVAKRLGAVAHGEVRSCIPTSTGGRTTCYGQPEPQVELANGRVWRGSICAD